MLQDHIFKAQRYSILFFKHQEYLYLWHKFLVFIFMLLKNKNSVIIFLITLFNSLVMNFLTKLN